MTHPSLTKNDLAYLKLREEQQQIAIENGELQLEHDRAELMVRRTYERITRNSTKWDAIQKLIMAYNNGEDILLHKLQSNPPEEEASR